jgi:hypothetical protein
VQCDPEANPSPSSFNLAPLAFEKANKQSASFTHQSLHQQRNVAILAQAQVQPVSQGIHVSFIGGPSFLTNYNQDSHCKTKRS